MTISGFSLYVHIPFCRQKCGYCDFASQTSLEDIDAYLDLLEKEMDFRIHENPLWAQRPLRTIFIGGGTPSLLSVEQFLRLATLIRSKYDLSALVEWSIEVNPESFSEEKAQLWHEAGVTRLSMGVQSLDDGELLLMNRAHNREKALAVLASPVLLPFRSVSVDLIYGFPRQKPEIFEETLTLLGQNPILSHCSVYELTVNENTPFAQTYQQDDFPDEDRMHEFMRISVDVLATCGYQQYEVSNFAKEGFRCVHNEAYWNQTPYLGIGVAAHSFDGSQTRWGNVPVLATYAQMLSAGLAPESHREHLSLQESLEEYLMLRLRTADGIDTADFSHRFGEEFAHGHRQKSISRLGESGHLLYKNGRYCLSPAGLFYADGIAGSLV